MCQNQIRDFLNRLGFSPSYKGYPYLVWAIYLVMTDCSHFFPVMKYLYLNIAEHFGTSPSVVQYAIRAILEAHRTPQNVRRFSELTGYLADCIPTPKEFIAIIADHLMRGHNKF